MENNAIKMATIHCRCGAKEAKLSLRKPKPPVPAVASEVFSASKKSIPAIRSTSNSDKVSTM